MAENSMLWNTTGTGDGPIGGFTQQNWIDFIRYIFLAGIEASAGVLLLQSGNNLLCTGVASPIAVAAGAALVYGFFYFNSASLNLAVTTPVVGTTGGRVVLRANWTAQTVRAFVVRNTDGVAAIPALTQSAGTTWEISLCTFTITVGGVITITDSRVYVQPALQAVTSMIAANAIDNTKIRDGGALSVIGRSANSIGDPADIAAVAASGAVLREAGSVLGFGTIATAGIANDAVDDTKVGNRVPQIYRRQGGSATNWHTAGTTTQTPGMVRMQGGAVNSGAAGLVTVTFPVAFTNTPLVIAVAAPAGASSRTVVIGNVSATTAQLVLFDLAGNGVVGEPINWIAIGTE